MSSPGADPNNLASFLTLTHGANGFLYYFVYLWTPIAPDILNIILPVKVDTLQAFGFEKRKVTFKLDFSSPAGMSLTLSGGGDEESSAVSLFNQLCTTERLLATTGRVLSTFSRRSTSQSATNARMRQRRLHLKVGSTEWLFPRVIVVSTWNTVDRNRLSLVFSISCGNVSDQIYSRNFCSSFKVSTESFYCLLMTAYCMSFILMRRK